MPPKNFVMGLRGTHNDIRLLISEWVGTRRSGLLSRHAGRAKKKSHLAYIHTHMNYGEERRRSYRFRLSFSRERYFFLSLRPLEMDTGIHELWCVAVVYFTLMKTDALKRTRFCWLALDEERVKQQEGVLLHTFLSPFPFHIFPILLLRFSTWLFLLDCPSARLAPHRPRCGWLKANKNPSHPKLLFNRQVLSKVKNIIVRNFWVWLFFCYYPPKYSEFLRYPAMCATSKYRQRKETPLTIRTTKKETKGNSDKEERRNQRKKRQGWKLDKNFKQHCTLLSVKCRV